MLKYLVMRLGEISTHNEKMWWICAFEKWAEENKEYVCEKAYYPNSSRTYYVRDDLRKAYVHLRRSIPNLFMYIEHPGLPRSTNSLEAFFGHIKDQLRLHRGLAETRVDNFIKWYLFFNDEKKAKQ